jgi:hypothetical protein
LLITWHEEVRETEPWWPLILLGISAHGGAEDQHALVPGLDPRGWVDIGVMSVHMVSTFAWLALLAMVTGLSWAIVWLQEPTTRASLRTFRRRVLPWLWASIGLLVLTGIYNQYRNVPFPLPHPWDVQRVTIPYGKVYVLLLLGKHIFIAQMTLALGLVTWRLLTTGAAAPLTTASRRVAQALTTASFRSERGGARRQSTAHHDAHTPQQAPATPAQPEDSDEERATEFGTAVIGTVSLLSGALVLLTTAALGYVHLLTHGHTP